MPVVASSREQDRQAVSSQRQGEQKAEALNSQQLKTPKVRDYPVVSSTAGEPDLNLARSQYPWTVSLLWHMQDPGRHEKLYLGVQSQTGGWTVQLYNWDEKAGAGKYVGRPIFLAQGEQTDRRLYEAVGCEYLKQRIQSTPELDGGFKAKVEQALETLAPELRADLAAYGVQFLLAREMKDLTKGEPVPRGVAGWDEVQGAYTCMDQRIRIAEGRMGKADEGWLPNPDPAKTTIHEASHALNCVLAQRIARKLQAADATKRTPEEKFFLDYNMYCGVAIHPRVLEAYKKEARAVLDNAVEKPELQAMIGRNVTPDKKYVLGAAVETVTQLLASGLSKESDTVFRHFPETYKAVSELFDGEYSSIRLASADQVKEPEAVAAVPPPLPRQTLSQQAPQRSSSRFAGPGETFRPADDPFMRGSASIFRGR